MISGGPGGGIYIIDNKGVGDEAFASIFPSYTTVSVRYAISDKDLWPETLDEIAADYLSVLEGKADSDYGAQYSEYTGYLWTDEKAKVGGHDLMKILYNNVGKFLWMEVNYEY